MPSMQTFFDLHNVHLSAPAVLTIGNFDGVHLGHQALLAEMQNVNLVMLGGVLRHVSYSFVGPQTEQMLKDLHAHHLFLGVDGFDLDFGPSTPDILEAQLNSRMIRAARQVTLLADSSKFGRRSLSSICPTSQIHRVITDNGILPATVTELENRGIEVIAV